MLQNNDNIGLCNWPRYFVIKHSHWVYETHTQKADVSFPLVSGPKNQIKISFDCKNNNNSSKMKKTTKNKQETRIKLSNWFPVQKVKKSIFQKWKQPQQTTITNK